MALAILIDRAGYRMTSDGAVVKAADVAVVHDVAHAFARAEERLAAARAEQDAAFEAREQEGYRSGLERAARDAAASMFTIEARRAALLASLKPAVAELAMGAIALIAKGLEPGRVIAQALEALSEPMRVASWAQLRVHPISIDTIRAALAEMRAADAPGVAVRIVADDTLAPDGCVFESEFGKVDASLATQLDAIRGAVTRAASAIVDDAIALG